MKKLMVLGAGISQLPLIKTAKKMGLYVIVLSRQGDYPGFAWADKVYYEDTTDTDKVAEIARLEGIDGICTTGTDVAVKSIGKVVDEIGVSGLNYESAQLSSNKWEMKQAFMEHGVRTAKFVKVKNKEEAYAAFEVLSLPLIFKAVDSGASKGIVKVTDIEQVDYAYEKVRRDTKLDFFIVEEFIEGTEFGAQAFVYNNEIQFIMPHGDLMFYGDAGVPIGHYVPYELPDEVGQDLFSQLKQSILALQLNNCAINADFILKDEKVFVLEIGGRAGATCLPELVSTFYGFDYYEQMVRAALHMNPIFSVQSFQPCACELLLSDKEGEITELVNGNASHEDIIQISFDYNIGDKINKFRVGTDRIGQIIVKGGRLDEVMNRLNEVKGNINVQLK
ncbi:ATP-grasp domain-containing protein [Paenibacillus sp. N3/727]|uniref:ATP-grasp domain-containing protein n=1 Tax=Paenibacillus sp. N3/727 TaxID=2925845 RepID=UPI001F539B92|nr:ATP-grasp domain-containing protein [Paenibacillus sp. N3/727]UNK19772.1 ATP-grasp domain-containing protein [Paenibacillus sp. N3/727]